MFVADPENEIAAVTYGILRSESVEKSEHGSLDDRRGGGFHEIPLRLCKVTFTNGSGVTLFLL